VAKSKDPRLLFQNLPHQTRTKETDPMSEASEKRIPPEKLVRVTFQPEGKTVEFEFGTLPYERHGKPMSFLDVAENNGIFLDHACGGVCACSTCHVLIKAGESGLTPADDDELDRLDMAADQQLNSRLGCQAVITCPGDYVVEIPKWNRNYVAEGKPLTLTEAK
jgi:2Fe-2S ferredoxin